jgi:soluble lytic murein transglycosylase
MKPLMALVGVAALIAVVALLTRGDRGTLGSGVSSEIALDGDTLSMVAVPGEIAVFLEEGRSWRAARALRTYLRSGSLAPPDAVLLAARAEAGWGGWESVVEYLEGREWLDEIRAGEGWFWLARGLDEVGRDREALSAYDRYLALTGGADDSTRPAVAELRRGLVRLRVGMEAEGEESLGAVRERAPYVADWMRVLSAEARSAVGDTAGVRGVIAGLPAEAGMRHRGRVALVHAFEAVGDRAGAQRTALAGRAAGGSAAQRAELAYLAGRNAHAAGDLVVARRELRAALDLAPASTAANEAADLLVAMPGVSPGDRLAIADVDERHGNRDRAAAGYRFWLGSGVGSPAERDDVRLRLGRTLFNAGAYAAAEEAIRPLLDASPSVARPALLLTGRAELRRGANQQAIVTFERLATRFPGSSEGSEGLHLVADVHHEAGEIGAASAVYRRVADIFPGTDRAGLSLMRLAGIQYLEGDFRAAAGVWEEYRAAYPRGGRWLEATYWAARAYDEIGEGARARTLYQAIRERDPLSYYALLASDRLGVAYWPIPMGPSRPADPAAMARVEDRLRAVDLLREVGLHREADAEALRIAEAPGPDLETRYALAEALNARGYAIRGIRIGQGIEQSVDGMNPRLLRILYPFPFQALIEAEAREKGLDPFVVAALTRQESLFTARISSPVGARGLMQIMPQTGAEIARGLGIEGFDPELLFHPEINVHFGTVYLAEQVDRYDGSLPAVFSAYNAGPHRIDAWMAYPEYGREELFTERIPFRETRDYVKILTRNIAVYRGLYGDGGA